MKWGFVYLIYDDLFWVALSHMDDLELDSVTDFHRSIDNDHPLNDIL